MLTMREKIALTTEVCRRYQTASKRDKSRILNEFVQSCGYNRSYARRVLGQKQVRDGRKKRRQVRKHTYDYSVFLPLRTCWLAIVNVL